LLEVLLRPQAAALQGNKTNKVDQAPTLDTAEMEIRVGGAQIQNLPNQDMTPDPTTSEI